MFQDQSSKSTPANSYYVPMVVEQDGRGERAFDLSLIHISEPTRP